MKQFNKRVSRHSLDNFGIRVPLLMIPVHKRLMSGLCTGEHFPSASNMKVNAAEHILTTHSGLSDLSDIWHRRSAIILVLCSSEKSKSLE